MVCVLDSTILRKCLNKIVCNLQRENHFLNFNAWKDNEKSSKICCSHTQNCLWNECTVPVFSEMLVFFLPIALQVVYTIPLF